MTEFQYEGGLSTVDKRANTALTTGMIWLNTFQNHSEISTPYYQSMFLHRSYQLMDGDAT
jgi:hypothetical protein